MIRTIQIENFRRFRDFKLEGLSELTVLTGPNGCGKSAVLDALLIGSSANCPEAVGAAVRRHPLSKDGARWLFNQPTVPVDIELQTDQGITWARRLRYSDVPDGASAEMAFEMKQKGIPGPFRSIKSSLLSGLRVEADRPVKLAIETLGLTVFGLDGQYVSDTNLVATAPSIDSRLIDPALFQEQARAFTKVVQQGHRSRLQSFLRHVLPELVSIQILTEDDGSSNIYLEWPYGAVPLSFSGDGIAAMLQIAIEAVRVEKEGLILIEEPEVFLHPKGISVVAGLLVELMREGRQIVITTHSLELIDSLLGRSDEVDRARMSLINLRPQDGAPKVVTWSGQEFDYIREKIGDDLR